MQQVYERAIANVPPAAEKRYWQRYIYLWINYALFEEVEAQDADRTREVHRACLNLIPHKAFTFAKVDQSCRASLHEAYKMVINCTHADATGTWLWVLLLFAAQAIRSSKNDFRICAFGCVNLRHELHPKPSSCITAA